MRPWQLRWSLVGRLLLVLLLALYVGSYLLLSRQGYAEADLYHMKGFYYLPLENTDRWRYANYTCVWLFYPLNYVDQALGLGRPPGCEPLWGLSR
jgi:hypothetical protein